MRLVRALGWSLALHGGVAALVASLRPPGPAVEPRPEILALDLLIAEPEPPDPAPAGRPVERGPGRVSGPRGGGRPREASAAAPAAQGTPLAAPGSGEGALPAAPGPAAKVDLFDPGAMRAGVGGQGGGAAAPGSAQGARERPWMPGGAGERRVASGQVPPALRALERAVVRRFRPPRSALSSLRQSMLERWYHSPKPDVGGVRLAGDPTREPFDPRPRPPLEGQPRAPGGGAGLELARVEVELEHDAGGRVREVRVVAPSRLRRIDEAALRAVREAAAQIEVGAGGARCSRWVLRVATEDFSAPAIPGLNALQAEPLPRVEAELASLDERPCR